MIQLRKSETDELAPVTDSHIQNFAVSVSRHDHHNIEVKAIFETSEKSIEGELDLYLFVPRSFDLRSWNKSDLERDIRSRVRLAIPVRGERGLKALARARETFAAAVAEYVNKNSGDRASVGNMLLDSARELCSVVAETLKQWTASQTRSFLMAHTRLATQASCEKEIETLRVSLVRTGELIRDIRVAAQPAKDQSPALEAFDEYVSHLYVQYLGAIRAELDRYADAPLQLDASQYLETRKHLEKVLRKLTTAEADYRRTASWGVRDTESDLARERRILRLSYLKKFFQGRSFVEVSRRPSLKKVSESTALAGTAVAGLFFAFVQQFNKPGAVDVAFQSIFVILFGVVAYVLRDRLKDWAKERFNQEARKFLPDYEQVLLAREQKIGEVKEWFNLREANSLCEEIQTLRMNAATLSIELRLPEDVFQYRKVQMLENSELKDKDNPVNVRALHENVRINFERYLKHMDDPFKEHLELESSGQFRRSRSHRVYHFYIAVRSTVRLLSGFRKKAISANTETRLFRAVLDKNGVVRTEEVESVATELSPITMTPLEPKPTFNSI